MGTSGSYGGSGGAWVGVSDAARDWLDSLPDAGPEPTEGQIPEGSEPTEAPAVDQGLVPVLRPMSRILLSGGRGSSDGPSGAGGGASGSRRPPGGRSPSGTGRSRARVGRVGGRLAAGIGGVIRGDTAALADLGLDLAEMRALDPYRQAQMLLAAATEEETATTLEEDELQRAANHVAIWALTENEPPPVAEIIRRFVAEYVYEVFLTEEGPHLRSGARNGAEAGKAEQRAKDTITALVRQVPVPSTSMTPVQLAEAVEQVYVQTNQIHGGRS